MVRLLKSLFWFGLFSLLIPQCPGKAALTNYMTLTGAGSCEIIELIIARIPPAILDRAIRQGSVQYNPPSGFTANHDDTDDGDEK